MRTTLSVFALLIGTLASPAPALACSCLYIQDDDERFASWAETTELIFQGTVIDEDVEDWDRFFDVSVEKVWKGTPDALSTVYTARDSATCGINLNPETTYIIFANVVEGKLWTGLCAGTTELTEAEDLIDWLNDYDPPKSSKSSVSSVSSSQSSVSSVNCEPYVCRNGDIFDRCAENGSVINYFVAPCEYSGGEVDPADASSESSTSRVSSSSSSVTNGFTDVGSEHPNHQAITFVKNEGIVRGYADGSYGPDRLLNRAEFTKIIMEAAFAGDVVPVCSDDLFSDISPDDWFFPYVCHANQRGVIDGYPDGTFRPDKPVNFAEAAKIVVTAFAIETNPDDHLGVWWRPFVFALARINGLPTSFSDPNQLLTRGDMAEIIFRVKTGMDT